MKSCHEYEALISAFLDGELSENERAETAEHLASCPACQQYFDDLVAIHDVFDQSEAPVPEGFAGAVMARVRETPQDKAESVILFPRWKRWAALAACCAVAALGLWSFQAGAGKPQAADQAVMVRSGPPAAQDFDIPASAEDQADGVGAVMALTEEEPAVWMADETAEEGQEAVSSGSDGTGAAIDGFASEKCRDQQAAPERENNYADGLELSDDAAAPVPTSTAGGQEDALSGILTAGGPAAQAWVEEVLGLEWEIGRTYLLAGEEFSDLLKTLAEAGEAYQREPGEGCWLVAGN